MNFWKKTLVAMAIVSACGLGTAIESNAAAGFNGPNYQAQPYGPNATPDQWGEAQAILNESYAQMEQTRQMLAAKRMELDQVLAMPNPDRNRIESLSREIGELRGQMLAARAEARSRLQAKGFTMENSGPGYWGNYQGSGPCWGPNGMMGWDNGWRHHAKGRHHRDNGYRGGHGPMGGCGW